MMVNTRYFKDKLFNIDENSFEKHALQLFKWQFYHNRIYHQYVKNLRKDINSIKKVEDIPFLPISFFKNHQVVSLSEKAKAETWTVFESSGTTGQQKSKHYVADLAFYLDVCRHIFEQQYGLLSEFHVFALLPSYLERDNSSLVAMVNSFIKLSKSPLSDFYLHDYPSLLDKLTMAKDSKRKVLLIGVTFALLELAEQYLYDMQDIVLMETGGMKGRRKEMIREEVHNILEQRLGVEGVHSEYGMTELLSQAYAQGGQTFETPPWMRVLIRDINDPLCISKDLKQGGINVIDLANVDSCAFIETQDLGKSHGHNGSFEVIGRFDNTDIRGCNLMVAL